MKEQDGHTDFASVKDTRGGMAVESAFTPVSSLPPQRYLSFYVQSLGLTVLILSDQGFSLGATTVNWKDMKRTNMFN